MLNTEMTIKMYRLVPFVFQIQFKENTLICLEHYEVYKLQLLYMQMF